MGRIIFCMLAMLLSGNLVFSQMAAVKPPKDAALYVETDDSDHDFGNILFGKPVKYDVHFQNISKDTLTLTNVTVSCGCTVPEWKHGPYAPRDTFSIRISFNGYADGKFNRSLTLLFNNDIVKILQFRGVGYQKLPVAVDNSGYDEDYDMDTMAATKRKERDVLLAGSQQNDKIRYKVKATAAY